MGVIIKLDIDQIKIAEKSVKNYLSNNDNEIKRITQQIEESKEYWEGADRNEFVNMWKTNKNELSKMTKSIQNYGSYLQYSFEQYTDLQSRLKNRAKMLPK